MATSQLRGSVPQVFVSGPEAEDARESIEQLGAGSVSEGTRRNEITEPPSLTARQGGGAAATTAEEAKEDQPSPRGVPGLLLPRALADACADKVRT
mmetsp:Transcript_116216/g.325047  ORF Transcript_116216/g.325047 Transcript_116216/m.325047 type:complete len:96 (+) Transcript_116216:429-716(+)